MKNKLLAVLATFGMVASASAVKINNNLSINGFIDGSYSMIEDGPTNAAGTTFGDTQDLQGDEVELNFVLTNGAVSGLVAVDSTDVNGNTGINFEQVHFTYDLGNNIAITVGRYGSALGLEREDPAGLYTFSRAYKDSDGFNFGNVDNAAVEGVTVSYSADVWSLAASFENNRDANIENDELDLELSFSYTGIADTSIGGGYYFSNESTSAGENDALNINATRQFGKLLIGAEYSEIQNDAGDRDAYLLLVDYDYNDKIGIAARVSQAEQAGGTDYEKFTIAPNYAITENLGAIIEYSDIEDNSLATSDSTEIAVELTYTF